jgi:succinate dehydrogenase / fumarate reductase flavoprotein subunit
MQGLADGYFILPTTIGSYFAGTGLPPVDADHAAVQDTEKVVRERIGKLLGLKGRRTVSDIHRELGLLLWNQCGMSRNREGLLEARKRIPEIRSDFWENATLTGEAGEINQVLEHAGRVADFLEFADVMVEDALTREESCGCHFREEYQTEDNEALRNDIEFSHAAVWEFTGVGEAPALHKESLVFEHVELTRRSYK